MIREFLKVSPILDDTNYIAESAAVIGDVTLGSHTSIWFNATVRGDVNWIRIGQGSNVQDNAVVHVTNRTGPTEIGDYVTIGHSAVVHGCTLGNRILVGINAVILDGATIGDDCIIGAGSLVTQRTQIPPRSLVFGSPARVIRPLTEEEVESVYRNAQNYLKYSRIYRGEETPDENPFYEPRR